MSARQLRFISPAATLEESGPPGVSLAVSLLGGVMLAGFVVWAAGTKLPQSAVAPGEIVPNGVNVLVQHLEGGIVQRLAAAEGDLVEAGQTVVELGGAGLAGEIDQLRAKEDGLALQAERLRAIAERRAPNFDPAALASLADDQRAILLLQEHARTTQRVVLERQLDGRQAELAGLDEQRTMMQRQIAPMQEQLRVRTELQEKGFTSRVVVLETERELARLRTELAQLVGSRARTAAALTEAEAKLLELDARLDAEAAVEMGKVAAELAQTREALARTRERMARLQVRAPERGILKDLRVKNEGAVVPPNGPVFELVPLGRELVAEVKLSTRDIGQVKPGQPVDVRVSTYDYNRFGTVDGTVRSVSPSSFHEADRQPYYKAIVVLSAEGFRDAAGAKKLAPGMTLEASIRTGERTLLQYLAGPLETMLSTGLRER